MKKRYPPGPVKALVLDCDGTMTDGGLYYGPDGQAFKRFDVRDGMGIARLRDAGVQVVIVTGDDTPIVQARARVLGIEHVEMGRQDKAAVLARLMDTYNWQAPQVVYMGDDVNDIPALQVAGFGAAPADAVPEVLAIADYVCDHPGGRGAVREVCDLILAHNTWCDCRAGSKQGDR